MLRQGAPCWLYCTRNRLVAVPFSSIQLCPSSKPTYPCSPASYSLGRCTPLDQLCFPPLSSYKRYLSTTRPRCINFRSFFKKKQLAEDYRIADNLDRNHNLVYQASSTSYIKATLGTVEASALLFTGSTAVAALGLSPSAFQLNIEILAYMSFYTLLCCGTLSLARIYPLRIYFNEERYKFIAVFIGYHPFSIRCLEISPGEVRTKKQTYVSQNVVPWGQDICNIEGKQNILLIASNFSSPHYYNMLLGY